MLGDRERTLDDELARRAATFARRHTDQLVNELRRPEPPRTLAVVRELDEWLVSLVAAVLAEELRQQRAAPGELIAVRYDHRARGQSGSPLCSRYGLVVDRAAAGDELARRR